MVISTLIDIEVVFRKNTNIKKKIMIDSKNINMNILNRKILEVCEIFPKLSGLNRLYPINLMKKTENGEGLSQDINAPKKINISMTDDKESSSKNSGSIFFIPTMFHYYHFYRKGLIIKMKSLSPYPTRYSGRGQAPHELTHPNPN